MSGSRESAVAPGGEAATHRARPPLLAVAGLAVSAAGMLLFLSIGLVMHTEYEMSLYWPWLWPASMAVGIAGAVLSAGGFVLALRRRARPRLAVIGMVVGLAPAALVAVPVIVFFVLGLLFGA